MSSNNGNLCGAEKWLRWVHDVGYMPDTKFVLHDVEEEGNMSGLCHHMTEDGCAFGLVITAGTTLYIFQQFVKCSW